MKIFSIKKRGVWHITKPNGTSYCSNARIDKDWYMEERVADTVVIKERDDETLCNGCVGMAYKAGVIEVTDKEVGGMKLYALVYKNSGELAKSWGSSTKPSLKVFDNIESAKRSLKSSQHREKEELAIKTYVEVVE